MKAVYSLRTLAATAAIAAMTLTTGAIAQEKEKSESKSSVARAVATSSSKVRPLSVSIDLLSKTNLAGTLTDSTTLEMRTSFGIANIPLSEVAGIRFASADNASTTVVMLNGDSITGATDVKLVTVETEWGMATINGTNIMSIMFVPGLAWNPQSGLNGKRWSLVNQKSATRRSDEDESKTAAAAAPATSRPTAPTRSNNVNGNQNYPGNRSQPVYRGR